MSPSGGPLQPPGSDAGPQQGPGAAGSPVAPQDGQPDPNAGVLMNVRELIRNARMIGMRYPAAMQEVREITNAVMRLQQKIVQSQPAPEPMSPPV